MESAPPSSVFPQSSVHLPVIEVAIEADKSRHSRLPRVSPRAATGRGPKCGSAVWPRPLLPEEVGGRFMEGANVRVQELWDVLGSDLNFYPHLFQPAKDTA